MAARRRLHFDLASSCSPCGGGGGLSRREPAAPCAWVVWRFKEVVKRRAGVVRWQGLLLCGCEGWIHREGWASRVCERAAAHASTQQHVTPDSRRFVSRRRAASLRALTLLTWLPSCHLSFCILLRPCPLISKECARHGALQRMACLSDVARVPPPLHASTCAPTVVATVWGIWEAGPGGLARHAARQVGCRSRHLHGPAEPRHTHTAHCHGRGHRPTRSIAPGRARVHGGTVGSDGSSLNHRIRMWPFYVTNTVNQ